MNARVSASPRISAEVFAARLAAHPALPSTGGPRRVTHALAKDAGAALPKALRAYLTWEIQGEEGRVGWKPVRGHAWVRSTVCVEHGPSDRELTRVFEVAVSEGWLPASSWERLVLGGEVLRRVDVGTGCDRGSVWIYATTHDTRSDVITHGTARYRRRREGTQYHPWEWVVPPSPRHPLDVVDLNYVPLAEPDPAVDLRPGRFAVAAWRWCNWPKVARDELRAAALWTKVPGAMGTGFLDGATAERVRALVVQHGVTGLEELTENRT